MKYLIKVSPVTEQITSVREAFMRILGSENETKVDDLIKHGGVLIDNLTRERASRIASEIRMLFVVRYQVKEMESNPEPGTANPEPMPEPIRSVPMPTYPSEYDRFIVFGKVLMSSGIPVAACTVRVFDRDLRSEQFLGETFTNTHGWYNITYTREQFRRADKGTADLVVRIYNPVGKLLIKSDILFNASLEERIDLDLEKSAPVQPSEYEWLVALLTPLLEGVSLSELTSEDVWFLANKTGRSINKIAYLTDDDRLAQKTGMPEAVFYGLASLGVGVLQTDDSRSSQADRLELPVIDLATVLEQPLNRMVEIVEIAISRKVVPLSLGDELEVIRDRFESLKTGSN